jgi:hypothetical protein
MDKQKKKLVVMVGLLVAFGVMLFIMYGPGSTGSGSSSSASATKGGMTEGRESLLDSDPEYLETVAKVARAREEKMYAAAGERDPMEALVKSGEGMSIGAEKVVVAAPVTLPPMVLNGIVWDPLTPIAMINGTDYRVGDSIKGAKVIEIGKQSVTFTYKSKRFVLTVD